MGTAPQPEPSVSSQFTIRTGSDIVLQNFILTKYVHRLVQRACYKLIWHRVFFSKQVFPERERDREHTFFDHLGGVEGKPGSNCFSSGSFALVMEVVQTLHSPFGFPYVGAEVETVFFAVAFGV